MRVAESHNLEIRKLTFTNHGKTEKQLEITSYLEVVGDRYVAELGHPAFNKLFIESEFLAEGGVFLFQEKELGRRNESVSHAYGQKRTETLYAV